LKMVHLPLVSNMFSSWFLSVGLRLNSCWEYNYWTTKINKISIHS